MQQDDHYPTGEANIEKKVQMFFEYGKRLKGQIKAMHKRELDDLKSLHADGAATKSARN